MQVPAPPKLSDYPAGTKLPAGLSVSTIIADFDFETYSAAGYVWDTMLNKWGCPAGISKSGISAIGVANYTSHPSAEVLCLAYDLKDGRGRRQWRPGEPPPLDLFAHIKNGGLIEAWNVGFENWVWINICEKKYNFPPLPRAQLRCAAAKARAFAYPGNLGQAGKAANIQHKKDPRGKKLITKFCIPRNPTKKDSNLREFLKPGDNDSDAFLAYNLRDIEAEAELSSIIPDLSPDELEFWQYDQAINFRGVQIDIENVKNCIIIIEQAYKKYNAELCALTNGQVTSASEVLKITNWLNAQDSLGYCFSELDKITVRDALARTDLLPAIRRVLEIRALLNSAAVKKLYAMLHQTTEAGRIHDSFIYHAARTGRAAGAGLQPQNLPGNGPYVRECTYCKKYRDISVLDCPWCGLCTASDQAPAEIKKWNSDAVEDALTTIKTRSLDCVELFWGDALATVSGCIRGLIIAKPGHDLICSDYKAIEAVVLAALAGEEWRLEVFRTHGKIYEMSASKITGTPFEEFERHVKETGQDHPLRKKVGKVAELASGYGGGVKAWRRFGADEFFNLDEMQNAIHAWRRASPAIVKFWKGIQNAAISAVTNPGQEFSYRGIIYVLKNDALYCKLLSGRYLTYHRPRLTAGKYSNQELTYEGYNTNAEHGAIGWIRMSTWGGKLTENIVQAVARDILAHAIINLEKAGYPVVLHVHDEIVSEIPQHFGSLAEFEAIMAFLPAWAKNWPVSAAGGWRGRRYRKD